MSLSISSHGWNPALSPSYSAWASIYNGVNVLQNTGLSGSNLASVTTAETDSPLFSPTGSGNTSLSTNLHNNIALNPSESNTASKASQKISSLLGQSVTSTQSFLAQMQQTTNPLFQNTSSVDMVKLIQDSQNGLTENTAPSYYLNTFNPYSYLSPPPSGSVINLVT